MAATQVGDTSVIVQRVEAANADALREVGDGLKAQYKTAVILLGAVIDGKPTFVAMSLDVAKRAGQDVVRAAAQRPEAAAAAAPNPLGRRDGSLEA
jgi:alanyl-tRNA synthetase